jgi:nickel transport protein
MDVSAFAHKVNIFAYMERDKVYTESYFNDGKKCVDSKIEVFDNQGNILLEGLTDEEGMFSFEIPSEDVIDEDLKVILTASMGHRAEYIIRADELRDVAELIEEKLEEPVTVLSPEVSSFDLKEIQSLIEDALDKKLEPIMREIKKSQEDRISPTEIIGGVGYIIGIFGIIAYFLSRKR